MLLENNSIRKSLNKTHEIYMLNKNLTEKTPSPNKISQSDKNIEETKKKKNDALTCA